MKKVVQDLTSGGLLGVWGKWMKHAKYIYNIQDFNPEQVLAVGYTKSKFITDAMMWFDKFSCKCSDLVITVGRDLVETVEKRFEGKKVPKTVMINNWIDENEIYPLDENNEKVLAFKKKYGLDGKFVIMYSGNIGLYYDLENLIKVVERVKPDTKTTDGREVIFAFVGAGSVLDKLVLYVKEHHMDNVTFIPYQDKADLIYSYVSNYKMKLYHIIPQTRLEEQYVIRLIDGLVKGRVDFIKSQKFGKVKCLLRKIKYFMEIQIQKNALNAKNLSVEELWKHKVALYQAEAFVKSL